MHDQDPSKETELGQSSEDASEDLYRIGTVAQLTQISVERLRAWERRYGLAPAHRAGKTRFYSASQLARLTKIKRLIDAGQPISSLVELTDAQLEERQQALPPASGMSTQPAKTGLIGTNLLVLEQQQDEDLRIQIIGRWANLAAFEQDQLGIDGLDAVVVQMPVAKVEDLEVIVDYYPEAQIVALYQFGTANIITAIEERGVPAIKWPASWQEIESAVASVHRSVDAPEKAAARRFSDEELVAIAASTLSDPTGCPQHLVELISQLNAFADYSRSLGDEPLLDSIHVDATNARSNLERALEALAMAEGLIATPESELS
jgi:DNA-binding transcriptional MerR regulator